MKNKILYQNNWCKIVNIDTYYAVRSRHGDVYFDTFEKALTSIGVSIEAFELQLI